MKQQLKRADYENPYLLFDSKNKNWLDETNLIV